MAKAREEVVDAGESLRGRARAVVTERDSGELLSKEIFIGERKQEGFQGGVETHRVVRIGNRLERRDDRRSFRPFVKLLTSFENARNAIPVERLLEVGDPRVRTDEDGDIPGPDGSRRDSLGDVLRDRGGFARVPELLVLAPPGRGLQINDSFSRGSRTDDPRTKGGVFDLEGTMEILDEQALGKR